MKTLTKLALGCALVSSSLSFARGGFAGSCSSLSVNGNVLTADCRAENGSVWKSSLVLRGVTNRHGSLVQEGKDKRGGFEQSCYRVRISRSGLLTAACRDGHGYRSRLDLNSSIENFNGTLVYSKG